MSIRASRAVRLLLASTVACLGLALFAQAALATHGRIQVAKINQGGNPSDTFAFHPTFAWTGPGAPAAAADFSLAGGQVGPAFDVACQFDAICTSRYTNVTLRFAEQPKPGYTLTDITCRYTQSDDVNNLYSAGPPGPTSPVKPASEVAVNLAAGTVDLKVHYNEWVLCYYTNTFTGVSTPPSTTPAGQPSTQPTTQPTSQPQTQVSPSRARPGSARLSMPAGCPTTNAVAATVSGKRIAKVTFYVDNKKVKTLTRPNKGGKWALSINMRRIAYGSHRVRAKVDFTKASGTPSKTLRLSFNRCHASNVSPRFTG